MQKPKRILGNKVSILEPEQVREEAHKFRDGCAQLGYGGQYIDIMRLLRDLQYCDLLEFEIVEWKDMPCEYAVASPSQGTLKIREDTYRAAYQGDPRHRFTIAHELGHLVLHKNVIPAFPFSQTPSNHDFKEDAEWQANEFAGEFLVDFRKLYSVTNPRGVVQTFKVSWEVASIMWRKFEREGLV